jgi:hypothetical protein
MTPGTIVRWALAVVVSAGASLGMVRASAAPVSLRRVESARLRLSWSARPERIEVCRTLSAAELAQREEHMRQRVECDGRFATYSLRVESEGRVLQQSIVQGAGLRHDRPLFLIREIDMPSGAHHLRITFVRREATDNDAAAFAGATSPDADTGLFAGRAQREAIERARRARAAIPPRLELDTTLKFLPERVVVVSFDPERRTLRVLTEMP